MLARSSIHGCCVSCNFYNLGEAHEQDRYNSVQDFANAILDQGWSSVNTAITNDEQDVERGYLEEIGFKEVLHYDNIWLHVASLADLNFGLKKYREERQRILEEKRKADREKAAARALLQKEKMKKFEEKGLKKVTTAEVTAKIRNHKSIGPRTLLRRWLNELDLELPNHDPYWNRDDEIAKAINYRIVKKAINEDADGSGS